MKYYKGFIGIELGIAIAIIAVLGIAAVTGYTTYHARMTASDGATTTPVTATSTTGVSVPPDTGNNDSGSTGGSTNGSFTVTSENSDQVVHLHVGDRLTLALSNDKSWTSARVADQAILRPLDVPMIPEDQGVFEAAAKGSTTITMTGAPICNGGACPQYQILFKITVVVD